MGLDMTKLDWTNHRYGAGWYRHYDGQPHPDDDRDYVWTGSFWQLVIEDEYDD